MDKNIDAFNGLSLFVTKEAKGMRETNYIMLVSLAFS